MVQKTAQEVRRCFGLDFLLVTLGGESAFVVSEKGIFFSEPPLV